MEVGEEMEPPKTGEEENGSGEKKKPEEKTDNEESGNFDCNICFNKAEEPVITPCGHLYCWPCIFRWLNNQTTIEQICPVCRAGISRDKLIPIYGRGKSADTTKDPEFEEEEIPSRPQGHRNEPQRNPNYRPPVTNPFQFIFNQFGGGGGVNPQTGMRPNTFGFRFQFWPPRFVFHNNRGPNAGNPTDADREQARHNEMRMRKMLSRVLVFAMIFVLYMIFFF